MEINASHQQQRRNLGKSTGVPIDDDNNNFGNEIKKEILQVDGRKTEEKKRSGCIFNKSFFSRNSRFLEAINKHTIVPREDLLSNRSHTSEVSSSDEWQLLEPDEEDVSEIKSQNMSITDKQMASIVKNIIPNKMLSFNNNNYDEFGEKTTKQNKQYKDISPMESSSTRQLSPVMIYLCTVLYASVPLVSLIAFITLLSLIFTRYWLVTLAYYTYILLDRQTCNRGGRRWEAFYRSRFWSHLSEYFPIKLRHSDEFELDPKENYILNYHPHGIAAFGCVTSFATNALNFSQLFPGITSRFMVHESSFLVPIMREIFSLRGDCSVNSKSFDYFLEKKWRQPGANQATGNLLALVGGGLAEADLSDVEVLKIVVANRKGFVKKALIHGANLIPCIAFGENSVFTKINLDPNSWLHRLESQWYKLLKFKHPFYYGTSMIFGAKAPGILPYKRPITVVMGDPIKVERVIDPTNEQIEELHTRYLEQLKDMYAANVDLCSRFDLRLELV